MAQLSPLTNTDSPPPSSRAGSNGAAVSSRDRGSVSPVPSRKKRRQMHDPDSSGEDDLSPTSLAKRFMSDAAAAGTSSPATTPSTDVASSFELIDVTERKTATADGRLGRELIRQAGGDLSALGFRFGASPLKAQAAGCRGIILCVRRDALVAKRNDGVLGFTSVRMRTRVRTGRKEELATNMFECQTAQRDSICSHPDRRDLVSGHAAAAAAAAAALGPITSLSSPNPSTPGALGSGAAGSFAGGPPSAAAADALVG
ncbi:hypothetical protein MRX96_012777 [Rhipicephalus microplus]